MSNVNEETGALTGTISGSATLSGVVSPGQVPSGAEPVLQDVSVKSSDTEQTVEAEEGYDGIGTVTVSPYSLQDVSVTLSGSEQVITADSAQGYDALGEVTVPGLSLENVSVKSGSTQQTVEAQQNYDGIGTVTVQPLSLQDVTVTLSNQQQVITADTSQGYDALGSVTVPAESGGGGGGGTDYMNALFNDGSTPQSVQMVDSGGHKCYGFAAGFSVTLPNTVTKVMTGAFTDVKTLTAVTGQTVTEVQSSAFYGCTNLASVSFSNLYTIGSYAFCYTALTSVTFNTLGGNSLGEGAFMGCGDLTYVKLGASQSLPDSCFEGCMQLTDLYLGWSGNPVSLGANVFNGIIDLTVHVRSSKLADYQANSDWQAAIAQAQQDGNSITLVGDYS